MKISLLVPFRPNSKRDPRIKTWEWLEQRWSYLLPEAELCVGTDTGGDPFSKSAAVNDAYSKATGDLLVIADADSWVEPSSLRTGIETASRKEHLVVPWWKSYRLTQKDSESILQQQPDVRLPVTREMKDRAKDSGPAPDSAAMVLVILRTAFERVGGFDPRFRGWGSEDVSFGLSCWTLLGRNEYCLGEAYALYHARPHAKTEIKDPMWENMRVWRNDPGGLNFELWHRYRRAQGHPEKMLALCAEHALPGKQVSLSPTWNVEDMVTLEDDHSAAHTAPNPMPDQVFGNEPLARETLY